MSPPGGDPTPVLAPRADAPRSPAVATTTLTWLGHSAFRLTTASGLALYVDPFLSDNPRCPEAERTPRRADMIALTHGHADHLGDAVAIAAQHGSTVAAQAELAHWLRRNGVPAAQVLGFNKGGTVERDGISITLTNAFHSSSTPDGAYAGEPCGLVVATEHGHRIYFAGDTCVFGDMQLIGRLYRPDLAVLPIGGHWTMDPRQAALALELLGAKRCVPCHFGSFEVETGTPEELVALAPGVRVEVLQPGESISL